MSRTEVEDAIAPAVRLPDWLLNGQVLEHDGAFLRLAPGGTAYRPLADPPEQVSTDTLAYYLPYHYYREWGIYLRAEGVEHVASAFGMAAATAERIDPHLDTASLFLANHELFHCMAETAATRLEMATGKPVYGRYFADPTARRFEEALANAYAVNTLPADEHWGRPLVAWMKGQPEGYRDFPAWLDPRFRLGTDWLAQYLTDSVGSRRRRLSVREVPERSTPTYLVVGPKSAVQQVKPFPRFRDMQVEVYTREHKPAHFHLWHPPDTLRGKFEWPSLQPVTGTPGLSHAERKKLDRYLHVHGRAINKKVVEVFASL